MYVPNISFISSPIRNRYTKPINNIRYYGPGILQSPSIIQYRSIHLQGNRGREGESDGGARQLHPDGEWVTAVLFGGEALGVGGGDREADGDGRIASVVLGAQSHPSNLLVADGVLQRVVALITVVAVEEVGGHLG